MEEICHDKKSFLFYIKRVIQALSTHERNDTIFRQKKKKKTKQKKKKKEKKTDPPHRMTDKLTFSGDRCISQDDRIILLQKRLATPETTDHGVDCTESKASLTDPAQKTQTMKFVA